MLTVDLAAAKQLQTLLNALDATKLAATPFVVAAANARGDNGKW